MTNQDRVVTKAMKEIGWNLQLTEPQNKYLRTFLYCIYDIGLTDGRARLEQRKAVQMLFNGIIVDYFNSEIIASNKTGYSRATICRLLKTGEKSKRGYQFKYF